MKRTIFALLLVLVLIFALVACGNKTPDDSDTDTDSSGTPPCARHVYGEWEETKPSTCFEQGVEVRYCTVCETKIQRFKDTLPHTPEPMPDVAPTCYLDGSTGGMRCSVCKAVTEKPTVISKDTAHVLENSITEKHPTFTASGSATFECEICKTRIEKTYDTLVPTVITKDDIYSIEFNNEYNPARANGYKLFDGNKVSSGIFAEGSDWFGYVNDTITITFKEEKILKDLRIYAVGNGTSANITILDTSGGKKTWSVTSNTDRAWGGEGVEYKLFENSSYSVIAIQVKITGLKWDDYRTFKLSEIKASGASRVGELDHKHQNRGDATIIKEATCSTMGKADRYCWCGGIFTWNTATVDHRYNTPVTESTVPVTCTTDGKNVYKCQWCSKTVEETVKSKGHVYAKLVECTKTPTTSSMGKGTFMCVGCNLTKEQNIAPLAIEQVNYLRVSSIDANTVTLKFNIYGDMPSYEVRYSTSEITSSNFGSATEVTPTITGNREVSLTIPLAVGTGCYYVAVRPYSGTNYGEIKTVRVGGASKEIPINYEDAFVYSGEVLNSFAPLFDNDTSTVLDMIFKNATNDSNDGTNLQGTKLSPIIDLEYMHYVSKIRLYYAEAGKSVTVRWSDTPVDFQAEDSMWDGTKEITSASGWNDVTIGANVRFIQIIFKDGEAPSEVEAYGYQCGNGDGIATDRGTLPTMGEMMGMCGFVAIGSGNTPIDSIICTTVLREYHNFGWSYVANNYGGEASVFAESSMGNFDEKYLSYTQAGINVIPCIQWQIGKQETISYKVDSYGNPLKLNGKLIRATFWERFDPDTYFVYADNVFAFAARYGSNKSAELLAIANEQSKGTNTVVGADVIKWIELGNEPDGSWNGINYYSSAYQLAAATSAAYDGHCATMKQQLTSGYHLGGKNADPNIRLALAGVSAVSNEYLMAICYWQKANRPDGETAFDAFNVHNYMSKTVELDGYDVRVGMSPEEADLKGTLSQLIAIRDKYYPEKEVWITEFGWDTNQSYATVNSSHAYGNYTGRQVQAMWLTRAYLLLSSTGIDKATMYMCEDTGVEEEAVGKFGSSGVIGYEYDADGNVVEVKKDSYYYLYTLKSTLGNYTFYREIEAYDENVMVYEYKNADGKSAYAVWCKTSDGTVAEGYQLMIDGDNATLVESVYGDIDGKKTSLTADEFSYVTINVSENPVYVVVE